MMTHESREAVERDYFFVWILPICDSYARSKWNKQEANTGPHYCNAWHATLSLSLLSITVEICLSVFEISAGFSIRAYLLYTSLLYIIRAYLLYIYTCLCFRSYAVGQKQNAIKTTGLHQDTIGRLHEQACTCFRLRYTKLK